jgi:hypothetical protein
MTKSEISGASTLKLLMHVFGKKPSDQTLTQFSAECADVKNDEKFIAEVREYALANAAA